MKRAQQIDKFTEIRSKLDKLNYTLHFDYASMPLIEKISEDLILYKENCLKFKEEWEKWKNEKENLDLTFKALKLENTRLIKENNELHRELVNFKNSLYSANHSKNIEIKKLTEEKNDFKFLLNNCKTNMTKLTRDNEELKEKHHKMLNKIYEINMSEENLRKLFRDDHYDDNYLSKDKLRMVDTNLGIFVKPRGIHINLNLIENFENNSEDILKTNNMTNKITNYTSLQTAIEKTFPGREIQNGTLSTSEDQRKQIISHPVKNYLYKNGEISEKCENCEKFKIEIKLKNEEIQRLNKLQRNEKCYENETVVKYLKEENKILKEKYEHRIDVIVKESKRFENMNTEMKEQIKNYEQIHPYNQKLKKLINQIEKEKEDLKKSKEILNNNYLSLFKEKQLLYVKLTKAKSNNINNESEAIIRDFQILKQDFDSNKELISRLDEKILVMTVNHQSKEKCLEEEINELKNKFYRINEEFSKIEKQLESKITENEDLRNQINTLQMSLIQKTTNCEEMKENLESITKGGVEVVNQKKTVLKELEEIKRKLELSKKEILLKETDIERLTNKNFVLEKRIEILEAKYQ